MAPVQSEASVVATGLSIRYISDWAYAFSGVIPTASSSVETIYLEFTSGSGIIVGRINFNSLAGDTGSVITYKIYLSGLVVQGYNQSHSIAGDQSEPDRGISIIIPPFTEVKCTCTSGDDANLNQVVSITGRVYGAE